MPPSHLKRQKHGALFVYLDLILRKFSKICTNSMILINTNFVSKIIFRGFVHAHVSYLSDECQACLVLLTVDRESFFPLSEAKQKIVDVSINYYRNQ